MLAKMALSNKNLSYLEMEIGKDIFRDGVLRLVEHYNLNNTLPIAMVDGEFYNYNEFIDRIN